MKLCRGPRLSLSLSSTSLLSLSPSPPLTQNLEAGKAQLAKQRLVKQASRRFIICEDTIGQLDKHGGWR